MDHNIKCLRNVTWNPFISIIKTKAILCATIKQLIKLWIAFTFFLTEQIAYNKFSFPLFFSDTIRQ